MKNNAVVVPKNFYTVNELLKHEAFAQLGIGKSKVYNLLEEGKIPGIKIGSRYRIPARAFEEWLSSLANGEITNL